jgi:cell division protein FtsB
VLRAAFGYPLLGFALNCTYAVDGLAQEASELQAQIERQRAENQALKDRIEQFERVLKTDVCKNPEAAKLLDEEPPAAPPPEPAAPQGK